MRLVLRIVPAGICCAAIGAGVVAWMAGLDRSARTSQDLRGYSEGLTHTRNSSEALTPDARTGPESLPDPNAPGTSARVFINRSYLDGEIFNTALPFTGEIQNYGSLTELREAIRGRGPRGLAAMRGQYDQLRLDSPPTPQQAEQAIRLQRSIAFLNMYGGKFAEATSWLEARWT